MGRLASAVVLAAALSAGSSDAAFVAATTSPGNALATGRSTWFAGNATGSAVCAGANAMLACPFGARPGVVRVRATIALVNKAATTTYTLSIVDGTGPVGISAIVTARFASNGAATVTLAGGATDTINLVLRTRGNTPAGTYTGTLVIADTTSGTSVSIPMSLTH